MGPIEYISDEEAEEFYQLEIPRIQGLFKQYQELLKHHPKAIQSDCVIEYRLRVYHLSREKAWRGWLNEKKELLHLEHLWMN